MGYTTDFFGSFRVSPKVDRDTRELLKGLHDTRRMGRKGLGEEYGEEGEFYYNPNDAGNFGQTHEESIIDYNRPPKTQPSLWLQWVLRKGKEGEDYLEWDGGEKFYNYVEWLEYLIEKIFKPRGYTLNGEVEWQGEYRNDMGLIQVEDNVVRVKEGRVIYE